MPRGIRTRTDANGYEEFWDERQQVWVKTHRRAAENKLGELRDGFHVHHRDGDKRNNRHANLLEAHPKVHGRLHSHPEACVRCGRNGHWASSCYAKTFWDDTPIED